MMKHAHEPRLIRLEKDLAAGLFVVVIVCLIVQVLARFLSGLPGDWAVTLLPWSEELCRFSFVWLLMLGASVGMYNQEHFSVTCVVDVVPLELRPAVHLLVYLLELVFVGFLIAYGSRMSQLAWTQVAPTIGVSDTWAYLSVPAGATLMGTHIVGNMVQRYFPRHRSREV